MNKHEMRALRAQYAYPPGCLKPTMREDGKVHVLGSLRLHVVSPTTAEWAQAEVRALFLGGAGSIPYRAAPVRRCARPAARVALMRYVGVHLGH
jgi:hypothetical protein